MNRDATLPEPAQPAADALRSVLLAVLGCLDALLLAAAPRYSLRRWVFITCAGPLWHFLTTWRDSLARLIARLERGVLPQARKVARRRARAGAAMRDDRDRAGEPRREAPGVAEDVAETPIANSRPRPRIRIMCPRRLGGAELRPALRRPPPHPPPWASAAPDALSPTLRRLLRGGLSRAPLVVRRQVPHSQGKSRRRT